ncbi:GFA family protein [Palleronia sp. LCG004]|uniref:GFA family protein n=1 Tax=Palleronia sp. LCG004 TaxID=3079304 RepID=UPI002943CC32|nr:GFA family protein [Palleronia sp. LCG004]WOI57393.1 GFA family protein [Palleronia sp. LCG004]
MMFSDEADLPVMGGCLCNEVSFRVRGSLSPVFACHCQQCRRMSGHYWATTNAPRENVEIEGDLRWYESSDKVRRAFCPECGSSLFWDDGGKTLGIAAGALDKPTGITLAGHIFCADKGDYYEIEGDLPKHDTWPPAK